MKENPIVIGIDDATFELKIDANTTQLIDVVCQGVRPVSICRKEIDIDGYDATEKLIELVKFNDKHVQFILTHSITFGGFNLINLKKIYNELEKPIIAVNERKVDIDAVIKTLKHKFPKTYKQKIQNIFDAGNLFQTQIETAGGISDIYCHFNGIDIDKVESLLQKVCIDSKLPECIRLAHLIGKIF